MNISITPVGRVIMQIYKKKRVQPNAVDLMTHTQLTDIINTITLQNVLEYNQNRYIQLRPSKLNNPPHHPTLPGGLPDLVGLGIACGRAVLFGIGAVSDSFLHSIFSTRTSPSIS